HRQRLDAVAVQVHDDQRRLVFACLAFLFVKFFLTFDELHFHVQLARHFLDLGQKEEIVNQAENSRGGVFALLQRLQVVTALQPVVEAAALPAAVLVAVAVVHGADKGRVAALSAIVAVLPVAAVLSAAALMSLALVLPAMGLMAVIAFATP